MITRFLQQTYFPPTLAQPESPASKAVTDQIDRMGQAIQSLAEQQKALAEAAGMQHADPVTRLDIFHGYIGVFIIAFVVTLLATPIMRRLAIKHGIIDKPNEARKIHKLPIAYLGGVAVFLGLVGGILFSYVAMAFPGLGLIAWHKTVHLIGDDPTNPVPYFVPPSILLGMTVIMLVGLIDDVVGIEPRLKIGGQLFAAAALAYDDVGVKVAKGVLAPTLGEWLHNRDLIFYIPTGFSIPFLTHPIPMGGAGIPVDVIYWTGTAIIAIFVLGACNASNLIDGLDGLLSGTTAICSAALLVIALSLAVADDGPRDAQRVVLCLALLGACLGFLPHNFNPATIFLGDCGSLLMGFTTIVIVLTLGDTGKTHFVLAGLVIYAIPIMDTCLAIVRRKMAGKRMSDPDSDHLHHMLKRALGVKGAVLTLYGIGALFGLLGIAMSLWRARVSYALAGIFIAYIAVISIKIARRKQIEDAAAARVLGVVSPGRTAPRPEKRPGPSDKDADSA
ncbi:MAG: undecaprenyl/decaprenyl-phosphate alpha-N-acetylglucosaminyl 1-phosphate transferase [Phycisphaerales bacterium]|nr:undecaprenyl/decaprenyl-phosphate alpha-N-acetylglucosaminyl 1-phosphate transferase [Phycisphaerales bacterium]